MASINKDGVLAGKVAVVTGASRGIGEAIAVRFAMEGARVVVSARTVEEADHFLPGTIKATVKKITDAGGEAVAIKSDLAVAEDRESLIKETEERFGPVDILVNNAAIRPEKPFLEMAAAEWHSVLDVDLHAAFYTCQTFLPQMIENGWGRVINITGMNAIHGYQGRAPVSAAKHG